MSTQQPPAAPGTRRIPPPCAGLVDDAAIFPPGDAPLEQAVAEHLTHRAQWYAGLLGPFVVDDRRLPALAGRDPLPVTVVVTGGAGGIEPVVRRCEDSAAVDLRSVEVALRDLDDLAGAARRVALAAPDVPTYVEVPFAAVRTAGWPAALDEVAAAGLDLKLRTGGLTADAFPSPHDLAFAIGAALDRELAFKCTAGLHTAAPHHDPVTGFDHHGFLAVLLATRACLDGGGEDDVAAVLTDASVADGVAAAGEDGLLSARRWFRSFGCCGVLDPLRELEALGLV